MTEPAKLQPHYIHGTAAAEQHRLEVQAELLGGAEFLPALHPGLQLLDVGCGTGAIAREVARRVWPGAVMGIDQAEAQLVTARQWAAQQGLTNLSFQQGDAHYLPWPDHSFDGVYERFLLEHVHDPAAVVGEMYRAVRSGGWACAYEWEVDTMVIYPDSPALMQLWPNIYRQQQAQGGDPWVGRKLYALFRQAGFTEVQAEGRSWTITGATRDVERLQGYVAGAREIIRQTRDLLLANQRVTTATLAQADAEYQRLLTDQDTFLMHGFCRVIGLKP